LRAALQNVILSQLVYLFIFHIFQHSHLWRDRVQSDVGVGEVNAGI